MLARRQRPSKHNTVARRKRHGRLRDYRLARVEQLEDRRLLAVLFADSFEQGQWNGQWVEDSQNDWFTSTQRSTDGSYSAEVDGRATDATLTMANPVDLTSMSSATLSFSWYIESGLDGGEYLAADVWDGSNWTQVASLQGNVDQENSWHEESIDIDGAYLVDDFNVRFRAKASKSNEDANVDNVQIVGTPGGAQISISDVQMAEGDSGSSNLVFTVTRSGDTSGISDVDFATADGTAGVGSDYVATSGTLQFLASETSKTVTVQVNGDTEFEAGRNVRRESREPHQCYSHGYSGPRDDSERRDWDLNLGRDNYRGRIP